MKFPTRIAYDCTLKRPGCVLLQATLGCLPDVAHHFEVATWLLAPTHDLHVYELCNQEQLDKLVAMSGTDAASR